METWMSAATARRIPLWLKLLFTLFMCVLVPYYWAAYGPTNFLYFCDLALFFTLAALWLESPLLASMPAVGIVLPQMLWVVDFVGNLLGRHLTGMTDYMFRETIDLFPRSLSLFHGWLPFLLVWLVWRLRYDRRAFLGWTVLAAALVVFCFLCMPGPPAPPDNPNLPVNINYCYGPSDEKAQTWMDPHLYLLVYVAGLTVVFFLPTHLLFGYLFAKPQCAKPVLN
jgi:hypothetical protein